MRHLKHQREAFRELDGLTPTTPLLDQAPLNGLEDRSQSRWPLALGDFADATLGVSAYERRSI